MIGEKLTTGLGSLYATLLTVGIALVGQIAWFSIQMGGMSENLGRRWLAAGA